MDLGTIIALFILAGVVFFIVASAGRQTRQRLGSRSGRSDGYVEVMNEGSGRHQHHHHQHHHHAGSNWDGHHSSSHDFGGGSHHSGGHDFGGGFGGGHHG